MLSDQLTKLREEKGVKQINVASDLGIALSTYANYEQGTRDPTASRLESIADYYGVTTDYLLGKSPYRTRGALYDSIDTANDLGEKASRLANGQGLLEGFHAILDALLSDAWDESDILESCTIGVMGTVVEMMLQGARYASLFEACDRAELSETAALALIDLDADRKRIDHAVTLLSHAVDEQWIGTLSDGKLKDKMIDRSADLVSFFYDLGKRQHEEALSNKESGVRSRK